ncbi:hypothetical protein BKA63DRAFT_68915 [Paraphoma chrysanthemicola]|nr:hypothetical protein BKA63DRAFT_68915 [Paraphoma chrysanthemicola]
MDNKHWSIRRDVAEHVFSKTNLSPKELRQRMERVINYIAMMPDPYPSLTTLSDEICSRLGCVATTEVVSMCHIAGYRHASHSTGMRSWRVIARSLSETRFQLPGLGRTEPQISCHWRRPARIPRIVLEAIIYSNGQIATKSAYARRWPYGVRTSKLERHALHYMVVHVLSPLASLNSADRTRFQCDMTGVGSKCHDTCCLFTSSGPRDQFHDTSSSRTVFSSNCTIGT